MENEIIEIKNEIEIEYVIEHLSDEEIEFNENLIKLINGKYIYEYFNYWIYNNENYTSDLLEEYDLDIDYLDDVYKRENLVLGYTNELGSLNLIYKYQENLIFYENIKTKEKIYFLNYEIAKSLNYVLENNILIDKNKYFTKKEILEKYEIIYNSCISVYSKERFQIIFDIDNFNGFKIQIYYPNITIKNNSQKHEILDLYITYFIDEKLIIENKISGIRSKISNIEYNNHYQHSHLPSSKFEEMIFCLGSGIIKNYFMNLLLLQENWKENDLISLFLIVDNNYISVESLSGRPYKYIRNLVTKKKCKKYNYTNRIINFIVNNKIEIKIKFIEKNKGLNYYEVDEQSIIDNLLENINKLNNYLLSNLISYVDIDTQEHYIIENNNLLRNIKHTPKLLFQFNNVNIYSEVYNTKNYTEGIKSINPHLIKKLKTILSKKINEYAQRNSITI